MTVSEYIDKLSSAINRTMDCCILDGDDTSNCKHCPLQKAEGKSCPMSQLIDVSMSLKYAVKHNVHGITGETPVDDPMVTLFIKRAVVLGYSVYTLRRCDEDYIKQRNLLTVSLTSENDD